MLKKRASGILLHVTSLPSKYGVGDLGPEAYEFVDFLVKSSQNYWQILPLNHTTAKTAHSPYNCSSAFAGNPLLLSPVLLYRAGLLKKHEIKDAPSFSTARVDYSKVSAYKESLFKFAFDRFRKSNKFRDAYERFKIENAFWLDDFATFVALQRLLKRRIWHTWPRHLKDRKGKEFKEIEVQLQPEIEQHSFLQYLFYQQWTNLKRYCIQRGIKIVGDIPIYVVYDSPDVWAHPEMFKLDRHKKPKYIAGVPPDYFSRTGQLWGNPVYDWEALEETNYKWWMERMRHNMNMFDLVRIDHFRGLIGYWQVPAGHRTAKDGRWIEGPKDSFFNVLFKHFPGAPFIAEDLGYITADVKEAIAKFGLPTMKVLQFAFDGDAAENPHIPHNYIENCIVYTGTHDNNTTKGWFQKEASSEQKKRLREYLGFRVSSDEIHWQFIRMAISSVAKLAIIPAQDILGLPGTARMNRPASKRGNWLWRLKPGQLSARLAGKLKQLSETYARN
jgi:4-alpha-glucanotransferase